MIVAREIVEPLCRLDDLPEGRSRGFDPLGEGRDTMFVIRRGHSLYGWRNACPHFEFARMAWKKNEFLNADGTKIICGAHGALFTIETGLCIQGPCEGIHLSRVPLELRGGKVFILGSFAPGLHKNQPQNT
jgi:nitrite reductase/ring-hydroxylating ferredoxin subunit